tara:strand:+ start:10313 stop:10663 length:351 start_codon:yes stop_codon:yes gene_type:complete
LFAPGCVEQHWNPPAISEIRLVCTPPEGLAFGAAFGTYLTGTYEHFTPTRTEPIAIESAHPRTATRWLHCHLVDISRSGGESQNVYHRGYVLVMSGRRRAPRVAWVDLRATHIFIV